MHEFTWCLKISVSTNHEKMYPPCIEGIIQCRQRPTFFSRECKSRAVGYKSLVLGLLLFLMVSFYHHYRNFWDQRLHKPETQISNKSKKRVPYSNIVATKRQQNSSIYILCIRNEVSDMGYVISPNTELTSSIKLKIDEWNSSVFFPINVMNDDVYWFTCYKQYFLKNWCCFFNRQNHMLRFILSEKNSLLKWQKKWNNWLKKYKRSGIFTFPSNPNEAGKSHVWGYQETHRNSSQIPFHLSNTDSHKLHHQLTKSDLGCYFSNDQLWK